MNQGNQNTERPRMTDERRAAWYQFLTQHGYTVLSGALRTPNGLTIERTCDRDKFKVLRANGEYMCEVSQEDVKSRTAEDFSIWCIRTFLERECENASTVVGIQNPQQSYLSQLLSATPPSTSQQPAQNALKSRRTNNRHQPYGR